MGRGLKKATCCGRARKCATQLSSGVRWQTYFINKKAYLMPIGIRMKRLLIIFLVLVGCVGFSQAMIVYSFFEILNDVYWNQAVTDSWHWSERIKYEIQVVNDSDHMSKLMQHIEYVKERSGLDIFVIVSNYGEVLRSVESQDIGKQIGDVDPRFDIEQLKHTSVRGKLPKTWEWYEYCNSWPIPNDNRCHECHDAKQRYLNSAYVCFSMNNIAEERRQSKIRIICISVLSALIIVILTTFTIAFIMKRFSST
jgi:sensor histidine kinase regulating citrate/malate metabolism